jgi:hypothetical protein
MRHIQDKDLDQLFKDRFEHASLEPSADLWGKINKEISPKKVKVLPAYWMAAAAIVVALTAGLLFINPPAGQQPGAQQQNVTALKPKLKVKSIPAPGARLDSLNSTAQVAVVATKRQPVVSGKKSILKVEHKAITEKLITEPKKDLIAMQPKAADDHLTIKKQEVKLENAIAVNPEAIKKEDLVFANVAPDVPIDQVINENENVEKKGIKNIGDLVNYVVDKVDKREQKFLKFETDSDENSSLVAINIGFIKLNSRKHK